MTDAVSVRGAVTMAAQLKGDLLIWQCNECADVFVSGTDQLFLHCFCKGHSNPVEMEQIGEICLHSNKTTT